MFLFFFFFFSSRRRHTRSLRDWSSDVCSSDLLDAVLGIARDTDGRRQGRIRRDGDRRGQRGRADLADPPPNPLRDLDGTGRVDVGQHRDELLAAEAPDRVVVAQLTGQAAGNLGEDYVAGEMPVFVVDYLEMVQVDDQHRG